MEYYAIEIVGNEKNKRYIIKHVFGTIAFPAIKKQFKTIEQAQKVAAMNNLKIKKVGNCYQIL